MTNVPPRCIVCGSGAIRPHYRGLLACQHCGHVAADVSLSDAELAALYRRDYFFGEEYSDYLADQAVLQRNFRRRLATLRRFVEPSRHRHLLEIGSAYGFFLDLVRSDFATVMGIDITEDGVRHARERLGLNVIQADFLTVPLTGPPFDIICLWDTIEHLREPQRYIERASHQMALGGLLAVTTGDIGSLMARWQRERWRLIHPPTHLHYFTRASLRRLLATYGLQVVYDRHCGYFRSLDNTLYNLLVLRRGQRWLYTWLMRSGLARRAFYVNLFDISYVIAQKTS